MRNLLQKYTSQWSILKAWIEARSLRERGAICVIMVVLVSYFFTLAMLDPLDNSKKEVRNKITLVKSQIIKEVRKSEQVRKTNTDDPNAFVISQFAQLKRKLKKVDSKLSKLVGDLIPPQKMAIVLSAVLKRETNLRLVSLTNVGSKLLIAGDSRLFSLADNSAGSSGTLQVYQHGLQMEFEGNYLDTIRYLLSLESLEWSFFWNSMKFTLKEHPTASIYLEIHTLSIEKDWIGV